MPGRKKYAPPISAVKAGRLVIFLRIGRFGIVVSNVSSWLPDEWVSEAVFDIVVGDAFDVELLSIGYNTALCLNE